MGANQAALDVASKTARYAPGKRIIRMPDNAETVAFLSVLREISRRHRIGTAV